jgi:hypothetical protein
MVGVNRNNCNVQYIVIYSDSGSEKRLLQAFLIMFTVIRQTKINALQGTVMKNLKLAKNT